MVDSAPASSSQRDPVLSASRGPKENEAGQASKLAHLESLLSAERRTLELISGGAGLTEILQDLCETIDAMAGNTISAVMLMDIHPTVRLALILSGVAKVPPLHYPSLNSISQCHPVEGHYRLETDQESPVTMPRPNWSELRTGLPSTQSTSMIYSLRTGRPNSSVRAATTCLVARSITSPVEA